MTVTFIQICPKLVEVLIIIKKLRVRNRLNNIVKKFIRNLNDRINTINLIFFKKANTNNLKQRNKNAKFSVIDLIWIILKNTTKIKFYFK